MSRPINTWCHIPDDDVVLPAADSEFVFGGAIPAGWEFSRSVAALSRGGDGRWATYPINTPRSYHDPVSKKNLGTLIEPQRTNLIYSSRPLVSTAKNVTVTADTTTQTPFGIGATRMVDNATVGSHGFDMIFGASGRAAAIPDNAVVSFQVSLKPIGSLTRGIFFCQRKDGVYKTVEFSTAGGGYIVSHSVQDARLDQDTDGFFILYFTVAYGAGTVAGGGANLSFQLNDGNRSYAGDGTRGFLVAYMGAEIGAECTSPILSSNAASNTPITRTEDVLSSPADWLTPGEMSFGIDYTSLSYDPLVIFSAVGEEQIELSHETPQTVVHSGVTSGTPIGPLRGNAPLPGIDRTVVITAGYQEHWLTQNGERLAFSQVGLPPKSLDSVRIGARVGGGIAGRLLIRRLKFWSSAIDREVAVAFSKDLSVPGIAPVRPVLEIQATRTVDPATSIFLFPVTLTGAPTGATFSYRTVDGTAKAGIDYTAINGTISLEPGDSIYSITVPLLTRSLTETRSFTLEIYAPTGAVLGNATCSIILTKSTPTAHAPLKLANFTGPLSADWSLTRATQGYTRGADGLWGPVPANQPRIHYLAADNAGILIEPASTQCLFESAYFGYLLNSTKTNVTTQTPVGNRLVQWRETITNGNHLFRAAWNTTAATWPTGDFILWAIIKPVGPRTRYKFSVKGIDNVFRNGIFELSGSGSVISTSAADVLGFIEPEALAPGWYRVGVAKPQTVSANVPAEFDIGPLDPATNSTTLAGNTAYGLDMCHFQCEPGLFWTSPLPVNAATAVTTRAADVLKAAGGWQARESFALGVKFTRLGDVPASQRIVQFRDISPAVDDFGILTVNGAVRAPLTTGATFHGNIDGPATTARTAQTAVVTIDTTRYGLFVGGTKAGEIAMSGKPMPRQVEHLRFGSKEQDGSQAAPVVIHSAAYWTLGLSDDEGTVFSADLSGVPPGTVEPDPLPVINIPTSIDVIEGEAVTIPITKIGNGACAVNFRTESQTASFGADYTGIGNRDPAGAGARIITFAANESTKLVTVQTTADTVAEPDTPGAYEKFGIIIEVFNNPPDCSLGNGVGVVNIVEAAKPPDSSTLYTRSKTFASVASDGGIGRQVYRVTNLRDDNSVGSLRYGINLGARHIIFEVGGVIKMTQDWSFTKNDVTISGETAPYPGITIQGTEMSGGTLKMQASKRVHWSHINFERCQDNRITRNTSGVDITNTNSDGADLSPGAGLSLEDIEFRHCSFFWSNDETISIWPTGENAARGFARRISFTDCMFCEPLYRPELLGYEPHKEYGEHDPPPPNGHNYGFIIGINALNIDIQYSMFTDMGMRGPFIDSGSSVVVANMIALNSNKGCHISLNSYDTVLKPYKVTCVGYLAISGPDTTVTDFAGFKIHSGGVKVHPAGSIAWVDGMYSLKGPTAKITPLAPTWNTVQTNYPEQKVVLVNPATNSRPIDIPGNPVPKLSADDIRARAIKNIGPRPKDRIPNVKRKIRHLEGNTGALIGHQDISIKVDGKTTIAQTNRPLNGSTPYSSTDTTIIPAYPTVSGNATAADKTAVKAWLEFFLTRLQYD